MRYSFMGTYRIIIQEETKDDVGIFKYSRFLLLHIYHDSCFKDKYFLVI